MNRSVSAIRTEEEDSYMSSNVEQLTGTYINAAY